MNEDELERRFNDLSNALSKQMRERDELLEIVLRRIDLSQWAQQVLLEKIARGMEIRSPTNSRSDK